MKKVLPLTVIFLLLTHCAALHSQEAESSPLRKSNFHIGTELRTKYIWRGVEMITENSSPVIFPTLSFSSAGLYIGACGSHAFRGNFAELDLTLSYTRGWVTIGLNDYFNPSVDSPDDTYFHYGRGTGHSFEGFVTVEPEGIPAYLTFATLFAGNDLTPQGKRAFSTYAEIGGRYDFLEDNTLSLALGATFNPSIYNDFRTGFSVCNIELKYTHTLEVPVLGDLPVGVALIVNPVFRKSFMDFSFSFEF